MKRKVNVNVGDRVITAVVADRRNPIAVITLSPTLFINIEVQQIASATLVYHQPPSLTSPHKTLHAWRQGSLFPIKQMLKSMQFLSH